MTILFFVVLRKSSETWVGCMFHHTGYQSEKWWDWKTNLSFWNPVPLKKGVDDTPSFSTTGSSKPPAILAASLPSPYQKRTGPRAPRTSPPVERTKQATQKCSKKKNPRKGWAILRNPFKTSTSWDLHETPYVFRKKKRKKAFPAFNGTKAPPVTKVVFL